MKSQLLQKIDQSLLQNRERLHIQGHLHLTKSQPAYCNAHLLRDFSLEKSVQHWITERTPFEKIMSRYQAIAGLEISKAMPRHYAMRVLGGTGAICSGKNIFLFFPHCLGLQPAPGDEGFGLELIDIWRNVFEKVVFPCARTVLTSSTLIEAIPSLLQSIEKTTYLASIFHEVGHRVGPWRVSPVSADELKVSAFQLDVMGELATDSMLVQNLAEFPEIAMFVTLQRLFWFGRRGYLDNPRSARINEDNDSWITACLWNELREKDILIQHGARWHLRAARLPAFYASLSQEIETLGARTLKQSTAEEQDACVNEWMRSKVPWNAGEGYVLPSSLRKVFSLCARIPEIPQFEPILDLNTEEELA